MYICEHPNTCGPPMGPYCQYILMYVLNFYSVYQLRYPLFLKYVSVLVHDTTQLDTIDIWTY